MIEWYIFVAVAAYIGTNASLKREVVNAACKREGSMTFKLRFSLLFAVGFGLIGFAFLKMGAKEGFATWGLYFASASFIAQNLFSIRVIERMDLMIERIEKIKE